MTNQTSSRALLLSYSRPSHAELLRRCNQIVDEHGFVGLAYCRISQDSDAKGEGVDAQTQDANALARLDRAELGWTFIENDVSASTLSDKPRPEYEEMLALVNELPPGAVRIFAYSSSRLTRRPEEWEHLIKLNRRRGVLIRTSVSGNDDLSTADGRLSSRLRNVIDAGEAERTGERVARRVRQHREAGISGPGGIRPFGFEPGGTVIREDEKRAILAGADILLQGGTTGDVIRRWERDGVRPVRAERWSRRTVQGIFRSPRVAGMLEWDGQLMVSTNVPPILPRAQWEAVRDVLKPATTATRDASWWSTKNLLSGVLKCAACGHSMKAKGQHYGCLSERGGCGKVFRNRRWVDELVSEAVAARLRTIPDGSTGTASLGVAMQEIARLERLIKDTRAQVVEGELSKEDGFPMIADMRDKVNALRKREAEEVRAVATQMGPATALSLWESGDLGKQRRVIAAEIRMVVIAPLGKRNGYGRHRPLPLDSVDIIWAS